MLIYSPHGSRDIERQSAIWSVIRSSEEIRTSHQIRRQADRLLPSETSDVDGNTDRRSGTVSVFNGSEPVIRMLGSPDEECAVVAQWLEARKQEGLMPHEIGLFVRSQAELERATQAATKAGFTTVDLAEHAGGVSGSVASRHHAPRQGNGVQGRRRGRLR